MLRSGVQFRALAAVLLLAIANADAVILYRTGEPAENTSAPAGDLADSGWQYQGKWGAFLGTPIAPLFFISAKHVGNNGALIWNGVTYLVVQQIDDPQSDLSIFRVAQPFPSFAPLYSRFDEVGKRGALFGRGTLRGSALDVGGEPKGWGWGSPDPEGRIRWGENIISNVIPFGSGNELISAEFNELNRLPNECHLSSGDSGGAAFIHDDGTWKLAGINYAVDGPFYTNSAGAGPFYGALFDATGYYYHDDGSYVLIEGPSPVPTSLYATRIARRLLWIANTIALPSLTKSGSAVEFSFTKLDVPESDLAYAVEQSTDLRTWSVTGAPVEIVATNGSIQTVKATLTAGETPVFVRLRITQP